MLRSIVLVGVLATCGAFPSTASGQAAAGSTEIQFFGTVNTFVSPVGDGSYDFDTSGMLFFNVGTYLSNHFEIGGGPTVALDTADGQVDGTLGANVFVRAFLGSSPRVVPYLGTDFVIPDFQIPEDSEETLLDLSYLAVSVGVKNYLNENAALDFRGSIGWLTTEPSAGQLFQFIVGLTFVF